MSASSPERSTDKLRKVPSREPHCADPKDSKQLRQNEQGGCLIRCQPGRATERGQEQEFNPRSAVGSPVPEPQTQRIPVCCSGWGEKTDVGVGRPRALHLLVPSNSALAPAVWRRDKGRSLGCPVLLCALPSELCHEENPKPAGGSAQGPRQTGSESLLRSKLSSTKPQQRPGTAPSPAPPRTEAKCCASELRPVHLPGKHLALRPV